MKPTKNLYLNSRQTRRFVGYVSCLCDWRELMLDFFFLLFSLSICLLAELCMKFNKFSRNLFVQTCSWRWVNLTKILIKGFSQTLTARRRSSTQRFFFFLVCSRLHRIFTSVGTERRAVKESDRTWVKSAFFCGWFTQRHLISQTEIHQRNVVQRPED